jgi:peptide/nickel transport system permease protein
MRNTASGYLQLDRGWGAMRNTASGYLQLDPVLAVAAGSAIFLTVLGFNFLGDAVRDALDPRLMSS